MHLASITPISKFSSAPNNPDSFISTFDLLHELATNRDQYSLDEVQATVYKFPGSLLMQIDRTCAQVPLVYSSASRPGRNPVICACISHGISTLSTHEDVKAVLRLRNELDLLSEDKNSKFAQVIWNIFEDFPFYNSSSPDSKAKRQGLYLGKKLRDTIFGMKSRLGLNLDSLVILSLQLTLSDQDWIAEERKQEMKEAIEKFYDVTRIRRRVFEVLFSELEKVSGVIL